MLVIIQTGMPSTDVLKSTLIHSYTLMVSLQLNMVLKSFVTKEIINRKLQIL